MSRSGPRPVGHGSAAIASAPPARRSRRPHLAPHHGPTRQRTYRRPTWTAPAQPHPAREPQRAATAPRRERTDPAGSAGRTPLHARAARAPATSRPARAAPARALSCPAPQPGGPPRTRTPHGPAQAPEPRRLPRGRRPPARPRAAYTRRSPRCSTPTRCRRRGSARYGRSSPARHRRRAAWPGRRSTVPPRGNAPGSRAPQAYRRSPQPSSSSAR